MQSKKTKYTVAVVKLNGKTVGYLTQTNIENGMDIVLDMQGFEIIAI